MGFTLLVSYHLLENCCPFDLDQERGMLTYEFRFLN